MQIQSAEAQQAIREEAKLTIGDGWPQNLLPNVQAVIDMSPSTHRITNWAKNSSPTATSSSNTIVTVESDKRTFVTSMQLGFVKDATCDAGDGQMTARITINGILTTVAAFQLITLTAQSQYLHITFKDPIEVTPGGIVQLAQPTFTAGKFGRSCVVHGFQIV